MTLLLRSLQPWLESLGSSHAIFLLALGLALALPRRLGWRVSRAVLGAAAGALLAGILESLWGQPFPPLWPGFGGAIVGAAWALALERSFSAAMLGAIAFLALDLTLEHRVGTAVLWLATGIAVACGMIWHFMVLRVVRCGLAALLVIFAAESLWQGMSYAETVTSWERSGWSPARAIGFAILMVLAFMATAPAGRPRRPASAETT